MIPGLLWWKGSVLAMARPLLAAFAALTLLAACGDGGMSETGSTGGGGGAAPAVDRGPTSIALDADPNGLFWDEAEATLYIADDNGNRILKWTDAGGVALAAELPAAPPDGPGLGQVIKTSDGTLVVTRFGFGTSGAVVFVKKDGTSGVVPGLDTTRRRLGLSVAEDGKIDDAFFVSLNGVKLGSIAELDLAGSEVEIVTGIKKPVGVLALGGKLVFSEQDSDTVSEASIAAPTPITVIAPARGARSSLRRAGRHLFYRRQGWARAADQRRRQVHRVRGRLA